MGKRVDVKTGFLCNNNCIFCVQADNKLKGNRSFEDIKGDLIDSRKRCDGVVLTGGEVSIREDFFDVVRLAKDLGYENIQIQTNGRMFSSLEFCKKTIAAGATEFSPALHGFCEAQHDYLTGAKGAFKQTLRGIMNLRKCNVRILTNTVVVKSNYADLPQIATLLVKLGVNQFQFAFVHAMGNAYKNYDNVVPVMSLAAPYIKKGLTIGIQAGVNVMVEAVPPCMLDEYRMYAAEFMIPQTEVRGAKWQNTDDFTRQRKESGKIKFAQCKECIMDNVCEGPWRDYPEGFGSEEFVAIME